MRRFVDVCNAIEYAHSRGVVHRDIKPSNIIVGKHGETLVVDWGLAKAVGRADPGTLSDEHTLIPSSASGSAETVPGSVVGTPSFMSPEQAVGDLDRLGPRSDVYSLGATLYVLLTGQAPFEGKDVGAVLEAVWLGQVPRPRKRDPSIDPALEAICLKAMARSPEDRYPSARALADDIERWSADEPVSAWHEPLGRRVRRWAKRHRTTVTAVASALVVALVGTMAVLAVQTRANADLQFTNGLLSAANLRERKFNTELAAANDRERARFGLALEAIKLFHGEVSKDLLLKEKQFEGLRTRLLRGAADFYGKLETLLQGPTDPPSRAALGRAFAELADLTAEIGNKPEALAVHRKALSVRRELAARPDADRASRLELAQSLLSMGHLVRDTGDTSAARSIYEEARSLAANIAASNSAFTDARAILAKCHNAIGALLFQTSDIALALQSYHAAAAIQEELASAGSATNAIQYDLTDTYENTGMALDRSGDPAGGAPVIYPGPGTAGEARRGEPERDSISARPGIQLQCRRRRSEQDRRPGGALQAYRQAAALWETLAGVNPAVTQIQHGLAMSHYNIGLLLNETRDLPEALRHLQSASAIQEKLTLANPTVTEFQTNLANTLTSIGLAQASTGETAGALRSYQQSVAINEKLVQTNPEVTHFQGNLAIGIFNLGSLQNNSGDPAGARRSFRRAVDISEKLVAAHPVVTQFQHLLSASITELANLQTRLGPVPSTVKLYQRAIVIDQKLVDANPTVSGFKDTLAFNYLSLGAAQIQIGDTASALGLIRSRMATWEKLIQQEPGVTRYERGLARLFGNIGVAQLHRGDKAGAIASYNRGQEVLEKLVIASPDDPDFKQLLLTNLINLGDVLRITGRVAEARPLYERAVGIAENLIKINADAYSIDLARGAKRLGTALAMLGDVTAGAAHVRRAIGVFDGLPSATAADPIELAGAHARLASLAGAVGSEITADVGRAEADRAVVLLRQAVAADISYPEIQLDPDFDILRPRADFQLLLMDILFPAYAFSVLQ